jgi:hypothetical protein
MSVAGSRRAIVADDARPVQDGVPSTALLYGEVRVGPGTIAIGVESLPHVSPVQRGLFERAVAAARVDPDDVLVVRITEASIEVDALDPADPQWPVRTRRVAPGDLRQAVGQHDLEGTQFSIDRWGLGGSPRDSRLPVDRRRPEHCAPKNP